MAGKLNNSPKIRKLAQDLGLQPKRDPVNDIIQYCEKKVKKLLNDFPDCNNLTILLKWIAQKAKTVFEEIHSDSDLERIKAKYSKLGEKIFANLETDLSDNVYGITFKRTNREDWEPAYISVIDCRGDKGLRSYFTKWHEVAHLLILTDQLRLSFRRTSVLADNDPEELMVDRIAGKFGFYASIAKQYIDKEISFEAISDLRAELCPEASFQASLINFVQAWSEPCILVQCTPALKKSEQKQIDQQNFNFEEAPIPLLRAVKRTYNEAARAESLLIYRNMRVPDSSVIYKLFYGDTDYAEANENLSWWQTSTGKKLPDINVRVKAKRFRDSVYAFIIPIA